MLTEQLMAVTLLGAEWILYILIFLSFLSVTLMAERAFFYWSNGKEWTRLLQRIVPLTHAGDWDGVRNALESWPGPSAEVFRACVRGAKKDMAAAEKLVHAAILDEQQRFERRLAFLGTLGNNAPFIGLFGTVLGIIRAFHDLSLDVKGGANVVMSGISEALVATAAGLFVAIPAVIAYNYFMGRAARDIAAVEAAADQMLAVIPVGTVSQSH